MHKEVLKTANSAITTLNADQNFFLTLLFSKAITGALCTHLI